MEISQKILTSETVESPSLDWCIPQALLLPGGMGHDNPFLSQR